VLVSLCLCWDTHWHSVPFLTLVALDFIDVKVFPLVSLLIIIGGTCVTLRIVILSMEKVVLEILQKFPKPSAV
jgi:hypothetical protein